MNYKYSFKPYKPEYIEIYKYELHRLRKYFNSQASIEHVGSTAVPGLGGKGIIDIALTVSENEIQKAASILIDLKFEFAKDSGGDIRMFFYRKKKFSKFGQQTFHVHLMPTTSHEFRQMIAFRDYLKRHPNEAQRYAEIKKKASAEAIKFSEKKLIRDQYLLIKNPIIEEILTKALKENQLLF